MRITGREKNKVNLTQDKTKRHNPGSVTGRLSIVGIGPGDVRLLTRQAEDAIKKSTAIVGYKTYIELIKELLEGKEIIFTGMTQEIERAKCAIDEARKGKQVCIISSGDPGVYGMAGLVLELLDKDEEDKIKVEIIPGVIAATACAGLLGAPLMHDFAVISLSDLLTDLQLIEQRVELAARADFIIVLYNPKSAKRIEPLQRAWQILMKYKAPHTPVGIVRNCKRAGQEITITALGDMLSSGKIDMVTTIIVGNSQTYVKGRYMITPRGYRLKENRLECV